MDGRQHPSVWRTASGLLLAMLFATAALLPMTSCSKATSTDTGSDTAATGAVSDTSATDAPSTETTGTGTSGSADATSDSAADPFADADFESPASAVADAVGTETTSDPSLAQATQASIFADTSDRSLHMTLVVNSDDVSQGCASGEALINLFIADFEQSNPDLVASSQDGLTDVYTVYISVDDAAHDLDLDGTLVPGSGEIMWQ